MNGDASDTRGQRLDPVARILASADEHPSTSLVQWLDHQNHRNSMRRRAITCAIGAWLLLSAAAIISAAVAVALSRDARELFADPRNPMMDVSETIPTALVLMPKVLVAAAVVIVAGGVVCWFVERIPALSKTVAAIDWSCATDAIGFLLATGCPYPDAFRAAAKVARSRPSRQWLLATADRVEQGGTVAENRSTSGDAMILESLIASDAEPQSQWKIAAEHFFEVAHRRFVLLLHSVPMVATLLSGLLVWLAISSTLGWMWRSVANMLEGFS